MLNRPNAVDWGWLSPFDLFAPHMPSTTTIIWFAACLAVLALVWLWLQKRDLRRFLEPPLQECGVEFVSSVAPGMFSTGPFPMIEFQPGPLLKIGGGFVGGSFYYRVVSFREGEGPTHEIWALLEFEEFQFARVRWRAKDKQHLPPRVLAILEA